MQAREFDFARLFLLIAGIVGITAFFQTFYQVESFFTQTSGFNIVQESILMLTNQPTNGLVYQLFDHSELQLPIYKISIVLVLIIPIFCFLVGIELLIRAFYLPLNVVHRMWLLVVLCLLGIGFCWWLSYGHSFEFYFFESVQRGYWWSMTMALLSLIAHFIEDF